MHIFSSALESFNLLSVTSNGQLSMKFGYPMSINSPNDTAKTVSEWKERDLCFKDFLDRCLRKSQAYSTSCMRNFKKSLGYIRMQYKFTTEWSAQSLNRKPLEHITSILLKWQSF